MQVSMVYSAVTKPGDREKEDNNIECHDKDGNRMGCIPTSSLELEGPFTYDSIMVSHETKKSVYSVLSSNASCDWRSHSMSSFPSELSLCSTPSLRFLDTGSQNYERNTHGCISAIKGYGGGVGIFSLALKCCNVLYSGSYGIQAWHHDAQNPAKQRCTFGSGAVKAISFAGDKLLSAHEDHKIRIWKLSEDRHPKLICSLPTVKDYLRNCIKPGSYVKVRRHKTCLWIQHIDTISSLATTKDGLLYSASWDKTVKVWRLSDSVCIESFPAHVDAINSIVTSDDGILYTASADSKIKVWKKCCSGLRTKHTMIRVLEKHKSAINALALSSDGSVLYSGGCDRDIIVWEKRRIDVNGYADDDEHIMHAVSLLSGHMQAILCLATVKSDLVCSGSADKTVRIWRRGVGECQSCCIAVLKGHNSPVKSITACYDDFVGCVTFSGSLDGEIRVWLGHGHLRLLNLEGL
ncbi:hypothetical protein SUGI_0095400 [Cryptomeria japonica]|uniref:protein JINGUBANG n=1 Tax=Cryptomeria japonica TaxID=3369 RepID=UPI00240892EE|nr:protein JINGUBANG [Cryptomeria japonica]GLJ08770.1 hypothetical protein SUGI_0095400 [Cryptomeria japonica]